MIILLSTTLYTLYIVTHHCKGLNLIDLPQDAVVQTPTQKLELRASEMYEPYPNIKAQKKHHRRYWLVNDKPESKINLKMGPYEDEKDANLKKKIGTLVDQTMHDTGRPMEYVTRLKEQYREQSPYRAGFILSMVKKSRDVLNELFNVALKHRNDWRALEQLKIFELIVHTNVDMTNLLKQLVEIHLSHLNGSSPIGTEKKKVVLL